MIQTIVKSGEYYDSITLLQVAQGLSKLTGVEDAAVVMGTPANKGILKDAGLLTAEAEAALADDLIIAARVADAAVINVAVCADELLKAARTPKAVGGTTPPPKTLAAAAQQLAGANIALVSVAGRYAAGVARDALDRGLHVFLFSDNVSVEDEIALKTLGREKGLLVMGPDAGTAIINGVALGFANAVIRGPVGVVAASGTGLQAVTSQLTRMDVGITQAIGTGGRDLSDTVGGIMMLEGLKALQADPATTVLLLVSKPPAPAVAERVLRQLQASDKPAVVCFLGGKAKAVREAGGIPAATLEEAAHLAAAIARGKSADEARESLHTHQQVLKKSARKLVRRLQIGQSYFRGLFSGGTFCYESQLILGAMLGKGALTSNAPVKKKHLMADANKSSGHTAVDLGADEFTVGRLHPMLDPTLRNRRILHEAQDPQTAIILLDIVLGYGVHPDPAGAAVEAIGAAQAWLANAGREVLFLASVCGTDGDPQNVSAQEAKLRAAGVIVLESNAAATRLAGYILS
ncbi:MAG TPA: acyl-CoA synthetase FdrA [Anaerolineae bacterium]|nr:acyl-CoA synthetase FdrA [Anaerolineae bacterium]HQH38071.1 acyl-CoA synthetase FdrA [Anaerolineae bacterium]